MQAQTKELVLGMLRELQQYMLCHHSGTTDSSTMHSATLDSIEHDVVNGQVSVEEALKSVVHFARNNLDLELSDKQMQSRLAKVKDGINLSKVTKLLSIVSSLHTEGDSIQQSISTVQRRVLHELLPLTGKYYLNSTADLTVGAMEETEQVLEEEKQRTKTAVEELVCNRQHVAEHIEAAKEDFIRKQEGL